MHSTGSHLLALSFFPVEASSLAPKTDALFAFLIIVAAFFSALICILIVVFAFRYRKRPGRIGAVSPTRTSTKLEILWTIIPLIISLSAFAWGAQLYMDYATPPLDARGVYVVGRQWMWKIQHPEGRKENNELHVAKGRPVRLTLASDDVIHSFFVPAFRVKQDAVPGRYTSLWFEATKAGRFELFCAEYCGTNHSKMVGSIVVLEQAEFQKWLAGAGEEPLAERGRRIFEQFGCISCHSATSGARGPSLRGMFAREVRLQSGGTLRADDSYARESIMNPAAKIVAGYEPIMPTYAGQLNEESVMALVAYLHTLDHGEGG
jgi:cytochrome c oxidase subunit 2